VAYGLAREPFPVVSLPVGLTYNTTGAAALAGRLRKTPDEKTSRRTKYVAMNILVYMLKLAFRCINQPFILH